VTVQTLCSISLVTKQYIYNFIQHSSLKINSKCRQNYWGVIFVVFYITDKLLIRYFAYIRYWRNWECNGATSSALINGTH